MQLPAGPLSVRLTGVDFAYADEHEVLRDVDLELAPGEIVAVCGGTGSGKSSLLGLVARFYDPQHGQVEIGGVDLRELALVDLRAAVAVGNPAPGAVLGPAARQPARRDASTRPGTTSSRPATPPASRPSSISCRTASTR